MKLVLLILSFFFAKILDAQCISAGTRDGSIFYNNIAVGSVNWNNPGNAQYSDNTRSSASVSLGIFSSASTHYLLASGFGFSIPAFSYICGIKVEIEKSYQVLLGLFSSITDNSVKIVKGGVVSGAERALGAWPSSDAYSSYGGSTDLWGLTWTPADINNANFGVAISAKISTGVASLSINALIDHIRITVYYDALLPVTFNTFNAEQNGEKIKLNWSTVSESNSSYFVPEKLDENTNSWQELGRIPASFSSSTEKFYEAYDPSPGSYNVYRIKEVDIDGRMIYSKTVSVRYKPVDVVQINVYPNPVRGVINIYSAQPIRTLSLVDVSGKEFFHTQVESLTNNFQIPSKKFTKGIYFLVIGTNNSQTVKKVSIVE